MFTNYFKTALRNLWKNKVFSFINIFGLTIGLASFLLIALYIFDELTFDRFHANAGHIYRVVEHKIAPDGKETKIASVGYQLSEQAKLQLPEVLDMAHFTVLGRANISTAINQNVFYEDFWVGNPGFLTTFSFPLLQGDRKTALSKPYSVVVTEETAKKLFGTSDVMGKIIKNDRDSTPFTITGVLKNFPSNSHISFNLLFSESSLKGADFIRFINSDWSSNYFTSYLLLYKKADPHTIASKLNSLAAAGRTQKTNDKISFFLQPLPDIHFYSEGIEGNDGSGNIAFIYVFIIVAFFILLIACINYMNLTTARFTNRTKEIAVRKVVGASQGNLVKQFLSEAFTMTVLSLLLSLVLVQLLLPYFNDFTQKQLRLGGDYRIWAGIILITMLVGLVSGIYPAFFQSALKPLQLLQKKISFRKGNLSVRRSLVVFQFSLSIIMIIATLIVYLQMKYVNSRDMGFNKEHLLVVDINSGKVRQSAEMIKSEFMKLPDVEDVSVSSRVPGEWKGIPKVKVSDVKGNLSSVREMYFLGIDESFLKTYQLELADGKNFGSPAGDFSTVLLNATAARELGIPAAAGQMVEIPAVDFGGSVSPLDEPYRARVAGIVKDFNFQSLREPVAPMILGFKKNPVQNIDYFTIRVKGNNIGNLTARMDAILHNVDQNHLFEYHFLDRQWQLFYQQDKIRGTVFFIAASLAILLACLGLFGLATFAAEQRIKEIGIRKVLGARVTGIVSMLSKDFLRLVLIALLIAAPVAWYFMHLWLQDFAYRINMSWWIFLLAGLVAMVIALVTISFKSVSAALANPVKSLRTE